MRNLRFTRRRPTLLALACLVALAGCGGRDGSIRTDPGVDAASVTAPDPTWPDAETCTPLPGRPVRGGDLVLALPDAVDPAHAPVPATGAERTVFANLYETLTRVACTGDVSAGLAVRWDRLDGGRRWRLHLRPDAVFWDGSRITAADVVAAWRRNEDLATGRGRPCPGLWLASGGRGLMTLNETTLEIRLAEAQDDLPRLLAHPGLAVSARREGWLWPVGSGPCRLAADTDLPLPDLVCRPNLHHPARPAWDSVTFRVLAGADHRDLLAPDVDLAVIRDRRAADFYAGVANVRSAPLPWDRLYVLLLPPGHELDPGRTLRDAATPAEHRPWTSLFFHGCRPEPCPQLHGPTVGIMAPPLDPDPALLALTHRHLLYPANDPDARALAERAAAFGPAPLEVRADHADDLARALERGDAAGYVIPVTAAHASGCLTLATLLARADWLQQGAGEDLDACVAAEQMVSRGWVVPLVQTRARLVWRGPLAGLALTHDGALLVGGLGPARPGDLP